MLKTPHHATVKRAEKFGYVLDVDNTRNCYRISWPERNRVAYGMDAKALIETMDALKMATSNYPQFKIQQGEDLVWQVWRGRKIVAQGEDLREAIYEALDADAPEVKAVESGETEDENDVEDEDLDDSDEPQEDEDEPEEGGSRSVVKPKYRKIYKTLPIKNTCSDDIVQMLRNYLEVEIVDDDGEFLRMGIDTDKLRRFAEANGIWNERYADLNPGMQRMNVGNRLRAKTRKDPDYEIKWPK